MNSNDSPQRYVVLLFLFIHMFWLIGCVFSLLMSEDLDILEAAVKTMNAPAAGPGESAGNTFGHICMCVSRVGYAWIYEHSVRYGSHHFS